jgi:hypothetical protein
VNGPVVTLPSVATVRLYCGESSERVTEDPTIWETVSSWVLRVPSP